MPYVMVPVPEEHVEEVMQFMLRTLSAANREPWDQESISSLFAEVDELSRALLSFVSRASLAEKELSEAEAATRVQLTPRETVAIMREINELAREWEKDTVIGRRAVQEILPNGRSQEKQILFVEDDIATLVLEAEKADLEANPHPLRADG